MNEILEQLTKMIPAENFKQQPETAIDELAIFEKKYNRSTSDFLNNPSLDVPEEEREKWINTYQTYLFFTNQL